MKPYFLFLTVFTLLLAACSPMAAAPEATQPVSTNTPVPTDTPVPSPTVTETPLPTDTPTPTATPLPTMAVLLDQSTSWCIPKDFVVPVEQPPAWIAPAGARVGVWQAGNIEQQIQVLSCTFVVAFNQPMPEGARFQFLEDISDKAWMDLVLQPVADNPNLGYATTDHTLIVDPPAWDVSYRYAIADGTGRQYEAGSAHFWKVLPNRCWDGSLPDPVTLYCKNYDGDWNYCDFPEFNPEADLFDTHELPEGCD